jgi:hypothetical protein
MPEIKGLLNSREREVLQAIADAGERGATDEELADRLVMLAGLQRQARHALYGMKLIADSGQTRATRSGRASIVWVATKRRPGS